MHKHSWLHAIVTAALLTGCAGSAHVRGSASISAPDLVYVSPGVQVIADYREPIFYSDNYYWRYNGTVWYRSSSYTSGWVRYQAPYAILQIERPAAYAYYRGSARATTAPAPQPMTRDERKDMKEAQKEERKDMKEAQKEERKEIKEEQKEQRKEMKDDQKDAKKGRK